LSPGIVSKRVTKRHQFVPTRQKELERRITSEQLNKIEVMGGQFISTETGTSIYLVIHTNRERKYPTEHRINRTYRLFQATLANQNLLHGIWSIKYLIKTGVYAKIHHLTNIKLGWNICPSKYAGRSLQNISSIYSQKRSPVELNQMMIYETPSQAHNLI
jgi:hypothetical protein